MTSGGFVNYRETIQIILISLILGFTFTVCMTQIVDNEIGGTNFICSYTLY